MGSGESSPVQVSINMLDGRNSASADHYVQESEKRGEQNIDAWGEQAVRSTQWLKSILPEASNGWWDIRDKGDRIAIKFRWRDPNLQVLTPLRISSEQLASLEKSDYEDAKTRIREQICLGLQRLSLDPVKRDKALLVARKLWIDLEITKVNNWRERERS